MSSRRRDIAVALIEAGTTILAVYLSDPHARRTLATLHSRFYLRLSIVAGRGAYQLGKVAQRAELAYYRSVNT